MGGGSAELRAPPALPCSGTDARGEGGSSPSAAFLCLPFQEGRAFAQGEFLVADP